MPARRRVAVVGLGESGIVTVKNLLEQGFEVTGFERNERYGGIWQFNEDAYQTSVLKSTHTNTSKSFGAFTDFPYPDDTPQYPSGHQVAEYLKAYVEHNDLAPHFRLSTTVKSITIIQPDADSPVASTSDLSKSQNTHDDKISWAVRYTDSTGREEVEVFDRLVMCTGPHSRAYIPEISGLDNFEGEKIHSQSYKGPLPFKDKRVMLIGLGHTSCDIATELVGTASKVYVSHRSGICILKRITKRGKPLDHEVSRRMLDVTYWVFKSSPFLGEWLSSWYAKREMLDTWDHIDPSWHLVPFPSLDNVPPVLNERIIPALVDGSIHSVGRVVGSSATTISVEQGEDRAIGEIDVDVIIFATSAHYDFSALPEEAKPTGHPTREWDAHKNSNGLPYARLFHNIFSTRFPSSLAFLEACAGFSLSAFVSSDVTSQAIAATWANELNSNLTENEINQWCDETYAYNLRRLDKHGVYQVDVDPIAAEKWMNATAGTGLNEHLGWGWTGWKWWWNNRELYRMIMSGVQTPFLYRLFEQRPGRRESWDGARAAIYKANGRTLSKT